MITALLGILSPIVDKVFSFIPNPIEREKAKLEYEAQIRAQEAALMQAFMEADKGQVEVNKVEAASPNMFVAGWRPFVGWVCASGFAWAFVVKPFLDWTLAACHSSVVTPTLDTAQLSQLLMGMLGMGAIRSYEKLRGVQNNH